MGDWIEIPITAQVAEDGSGHVSAAQLINLMLVPSPPGAVERFAIKQTPAIIHGHTGGAVPRGIGMYGGHIMSIRDDDLWITEYGVSDTLIVAAALAGTAPCRMVETSNKLVFVAVGGAGAACTDATATAITLPAGNIADVAYQDGYTIYARSGTDEFYISALDDPTTIGALDFATADALPGYIVGLISDHRELVIFKDHSIEFWVNTGNPSFPFERSQPGVAERGCAAAQSIAKYGNRVFWIGDDNRVYSMSGYQPQPISTRWIDTALALTGHLYRASIVLYDGRAFYALQYSSNNGHGYWYDIELGVWHKRTSTGVGGTPWIMRDPAGGNLTLGWNLAGSSAAIGVLVGTSYKDTGESAPLRTMTLEAVGHGARRARMDAVMLEMMPQSVSGDVSLYFSDNGGSSYSSAKTAAGTTGRPVWWRLGAFRRRILRITFVANCALAITRLFIKSDALE